MPDLGAVAAPLANLLAPALSSMVGAAVGSFLRTSLGMLVLGGALAGTSFVLAAQASWVHGVIAALLALFLCAAIGAVLATKRAVLRGALEGLRCHEVGRRAIGIVFDRVMALDAASAARRIPLASAEAMLRRAVEEIAGAEPTGGGLRGRVRRGIAAVVLSRIEAVTLARFRAEGEPGAVAGDEGGIDLAKVRDHLAVTVDAALIERVEGAVCAATLAAVLGAIGLASIAGLSLRKLPG